MKQSSSPATQRADSACSDVSRSDSGRPDSACSDVSRSDSGRSDSACSDVSRADSPFKHEPYAPLPIGLRLVQAYFATMLLVALANGAMFDPDNYDYDLSMLVSLFLTGTATVSVWVIQIRSSRARILATMNIVIASVLIGIDMALGTFKDMASQTGEPLAIAILVVGAILALTVIIYLLFSEKVRSVLTRVYTYDDAPGGQTWELPLLKRLRTWEFWRDLGIYFVAFSFLGHWAEMAFCQLIRLGLVMGEYDPTNAMLWDQWLYPFSAEGIAVALIVLLLHPLSRWLLRKTNGHMVPAVILSFFANALVCTCIDFTTGITANYDYHLWDYSNMPFNFMGQICLQNSMVYSLAATLIVWVVYPLMDKGMRKLPKLLVDGFFWFLAGVYGFLALLHFMYYSPAGFIFG